MSDNQVWALQPAQQVYLCNIVFHWYNLYSRGRVNSITERVKSIFSHFDVTEKTGIYPWYIALSFSKTSKKLSASFKIQIYIEEQNVWGTVR